MNPLRRFAFEAKAKKALGPLRAFVVTAASGKIKSLLTKIVRIPKAQKAKSKKQTGQLVFYNYF